MSSLAPSATENRLLAVLPTRAAGRMLDAAQAVELRLGDVLHESDERVTHVYFPTDSFISLMIPVDRNAFLEVGMVGNEGMVGASLILGVDRSPLRAQVQGAGPAWRLSARSFAAELKRCVELRTLLQRYTQVRLGQLAQMAACTRFHLIEARLARLLLMTQDRAHGAAFRVTHEFLAFMLGVRRVGVTRAASALQRRRLIRYHRGEVTILDRAGMKKAACSCYQADLDRYGTILAGI
jgi:hypothetical protein